MWRHVWSAPPPVSSHRRAPRLGDSSKSAEPARADQPARRSRPSGRAALRNDGSLLDVAAMKALVSRPTRPRPNQKTRAAGPAGAVRRIAFRQVSVSATRVKRYRRPGLKADYATLIHPTCSLQVHFLNPALRSNAGTMPQPKSGSKDIYTPNPTAKPEAVRCGSRALGPSPDSGEGLLG